jgi:Arc/MetJ family transcription regulator
MAHTTLEIDDELVAEVMRCYGLRTTEEVVDFALRRLAGPPLSRELLSELDDDLAALQRLGAAELPDLS